MDEDALGDVRSATQAALSRARLATDPVLKKQWAALAGAWLTLLTKLEERQPIRMTPRRHRPSSPARDRR